MLKTNDSFIFKKGEKDKLSPHFSTIEFQCRCSYDTCIDQIVSIDLINRLELLRKDLNIPLKINSGYRCTKYQQHLRDTKASTVVAKKSQHELGCAADVACNIPVDDFEKAMAKYFDAIGIAKNFLHCDTRKIGSPLRWKY